MVGDAAPWLSVIGLGEDGLDGLTPAARATLEAADLVLGGPRHLRLVAPLGKPARAWATPFAESRALLAAIRAEGAARRVVALVSGDPFWRGAGPTLAEWLAEIAPAERLGVHLAPSTVSLAAARLGWRLEAVVALGLHARPLATLLPHLAPGARLIVLLRDGAAVVELATKVSGWGFGPSRMHCLEALGGPRERVRHARADEAEAAFAGAAHPVAVAIEVEAGRRARPLPRVGGLDDDWFEHDGQLTRREVRALTLSSLAPLPGALLWDIGAGAGSIGIEWLLAHPFNRALGLEQRPDRLARAARNAEALGVPHFELGLGAAPQGLEGWPTPDAVFVGGGASEATFALAWAALRPGGRLVVNAVTLDTEALVLAWRARIGGEAVRLQLSRPETVGPRPDGPEIWRAAAPLLHWRAVKP